MAKLNREEFVLTGIATLRTGKQKGLRVGETFEAAFKEYYGDKANLLATIGKLGRAGKVVAFSTGRNGKTHLILYTPDNTPKPKSTPASILAAMGITAHKHVKVTAN